MKAFKRWCEDNGRRWIGVLDGYAEFEKNAKDYEKEEAREYHTSYEGEGIIPNLTSLGGTYGAILLRSKS